MVNYCCLTFGQPVRLPQGDPIPQTASCNSVPTTQRDVRTYGCEVLSTPPSSGFTGWLIDCLTSQQRATVSQERICSHSCACCHTEIQVADQAWCLAHSRYTNTGVASPRADPETPYARQFVGCLTSQQHASVSQGQICPDNFTCCQTEIEAADPTFHLTQSQYTDTGPTSPSADPIPPSAWQGIATGVPILKSLV